MKSALAQIDAWLDGVKVDVRLTNSCFKVAYQLSRKTNGNEFRKTGRLITWQSIATLAKATGLSERTVRYVVRQLEAAGHLAIETGHGPRSSNRYTLIQMRQPVAACTRANTGNGLPHSEKLKWQYPTRKAANFDTEIGNGLPPNSSIKPSITLPTVGETEHCGPLRADALGPLGALEADLRQTLGYRFRYLAGARLVQAPAGAVRLSVLTDEARVLIRRNCEAEILAASGASYLEFVVEILADPPNARRRSRLGASSDRAANRTGRIAGKMGDDHED